MMSTEPIIDNIVEIVGDHEIPCDFHEYSSCGPATARWIMHVRCPGCGHSPTLLVCGTDKATLDSSEAGLLCGACDELVAPARHMFYRIEWLK